MTFETSKSTLIRAQLLFNHSISFYSDLYQSVLKHHGVNISYFLLFGDPLFTFLDHLLWKNVNTRVYKWRLTTLSDGKKGARFSQMCSLQTETTLRVYGCLACVTNVFR